MDNTRPWGNLKVDQFYLVNMKANNISNKRKLFPRGYQYQDFFSAFSQSFGQVWCTLFLWWHDERTRSYHHAMQLSGFYAFVERKREIKEIASSPKKYFLCNGNKLMSYEQCLICLFSLLSNSDHVWFLTPNLSRSVVDKCYYFTKGGQFRKQTSGFVEKRDAAVVSPDHYSLWIKMMD